MADTQKDRIMKNLNLTSAEAEELLAYDKEVDKGKPCKYDLDKEAEKQAIKMANVITHKSTNRKKRTVPENPIKRLIISKIVDFLSKDVENLKIINPERVITFKINDNNYEITLTQKRKPKN